MLVQKLTPPSLLLISVSYGTSSIRCQYRVTARPHAFSLLLIPKTGSTGHGKLHAGSPPTQNIKTSDTANLFRFHPDSGSSFYD